MSTLIDLVSNHVFFNHVLSLFYDGNENFPVFSSGFELTTPPKLTDDAQVSELRRPESIHCTCVVAYGASPIIMP